MSWLDDDFIISVFSPLVDWVEDVIDKHPLELIAGVVVLICLIFLQATV